MTWILIVICMIVFCGSAAYLLLYGQNKISAEKEFNQMRKSFRDLSGLYAQNSDLVGWIRVDGTRIDYPVMQTPDNPEYYLHRDFNKEYSDSGTPFLDANSRIGGTWNRIIYGHNMKFGTMFHDLQKYDSKEFWDAHKTFSVDVYDPETGIIDPEVYEIFEVTGFTSILNVSKKLREVSVDGCEIVGHGAMGTVYRIDEDTIVKVYELPDSIPMILNEQKRAKQAFLKGIPTAISYDIVRVGDKYGSVFEMLKASNYNDILRNAPERKEEIVRDYARFLRKIHAVVMEPGELPDMREVYRGYLERIRALLPEKLYDRLQALFSAMPENLHTIHGDIHMKNIMLDGDEPLLIDMEALAVGDPVFDLQGVFVTYQLFGEDDPDNSMRFLGISRELADYVWEKTMAFYFDGCDASLLEAAKRKIRIAAYVRFLWLIVEYEDPEETLTTLAHLTGIADTVDSLEIGRDP